MSDEEWYKLRRTIDTAREELDEAARASSEPDTFTKIVELGKGFKKPPSNIN